MRRIRRAQRDISKRKKEASSSNNSTNQEEEETIEVETGGVGVEEEAAKDHQDKNPSSTRSIRNPIIGSFIYMILISIQWSLKKRKALIVLKFMYSRKTHLVRKNNKKKFSPMRMNSTIYNNLISLKQRSLSHRR